MTDREAMAQALALAERGRGYVEPNPLVGAVVVRDGQLIGEGWHQRYGQTHAEVNALAAAGDAARGATLFVTLEPCCHHGKTPPCTDALIRAGIARVVAAMSDPFPEVASKGAELLRAAGIAVEMGLCEAEARRLNAPYLKLLAKGRPYVHAKWAMTLDGKIATRSGDSKWISNEASRRRVHELRGRMDAIIVGIGTVLADDPQLTARPPGPRTPTRIVLDMHARIPLTSQLVQTAHQTPTLIVSSQDHLSPDMADGLRAAGCDLLFPKLCGSAASLLDVLDELGRRRLTNVLVEGGSGVLGLFHDVSEIDEVHVFIAPRLIGGANAKMPVAGLGAEMISHGVKLSDWRVEMIEGDAYVHGWR